MHAELDHQEGELGEQFNLNVTVSGDLSGKVQLPEIPDLAVGSTGTSTSMSWINGTMSRETSYSFVLEPQKEGTYTIPSLKLKVDDEWVTTEALTITVRGGGSAPPSNPSRSRNRSHAQNNQQPSAQEEETEDSQSNPKIFIEREFSKTNPYEGEPIVVTTKIYHRVQIANIESHNEKVSGVRVIDINQFNAQEQRGNTTYNVIVIKQTLIPLRSGKINLAGFRIKAGILVASPQNQRRRGGSPFDDFFEDFFSGSRNRVVNRVVSSKDAELNVKPVPTQGRPADYKDLVGTFRIDSEINKTELKAGETATLTVTVDGVGALDTMGGLDLQIGPKFRVYPDKPQGTEKASDKYGLESKRTFRFAVVPLQQGEFKLGQLKVSYFDPRVEKFQDLVAELGALKVAEGDESFAVSTDAATAGTLTHNAPRLNVKALANDLVDIHRNFSLDRKQTISEKDYFLACLLGGVPGLLCLMFFLIQALKSRGPSRDGSRRKKALKNFERRLKKIQGEAKSDRILEESYSAYRDFIGEKFDLHGKALTAKEIASELSKMQVSKDTRLEIENLAATIEQSQYARESIPDHEVGDLLGKMMKLARELEKQC